MVSIDGLTAGYGANTVFRNLSLTLQDGRIYALIGPSGCGKSTLVKILCGLITPEAGFVHHPPGMRIGYVPQHYGLLPWKTVRQNIFLPLMLKNSRSAAITSPQAEAVIQTLGLHDLLTQYPHELSGGQRQRAALARAFITKPDLLLMDEPFSSLDAFTAQACQKLFLRLWSRKNVTTLFITHNMHEAARLGQEILILSPTPSAGNAGCDCIGAVAHTAGVQLKRLPNPSFSLEPEDITPASRQHTGLRPHRTERQRAATLAVLDAIQTELNTCIAGDAE